MTGADDWNRFSAYRQGLQPPLKPDSAMVERLADIVADRDEHVLLLGMTTEYATVGRAITIAEWNANTLETNWPTNRPDAIPLNVDWRTMRFDGRPFSAAVGDGSLNSTTYPDDYAPIFESLRLCLAPGARIAVRFYITPDRRENLDAIRDDTLAGNESSFHALKWRLAMAVTPEPGGTVQVTEILAAFEQCFPDREALVAATGWTAETIAEIDRYNGQKTILNFPTRAQILDEIPGDFTNVRFEKSGDYPLADRCPFLVAEFDGGS